MTKQQRDVLWAQEGISDWYKLIGDDELHDYYTARIRLLREALSYYEKTGPEMGMTARNALFIDTCIYPS